MAGMMQGDALLSFLLPAALSLGLVTVLLMLTGALRATARARDEVAELRQSLAATLERARRGDEAESETIRLRARIEEAQQQRAEGAAALAARQARVEELERAGQAAEARLSAQEGEIERLRQRLDQAAEARAGVENRFEALRASHQARVEELERAKADLAQRFAELAGKALRTNSESFLQLVSERQAKHDHESRAVSDRQQSNFREMVAGLAERLARFDSHIGEIEKARNEAYGAISSQVQALTEGQRNLGQETRRLVQALRAPKTRGRWGEMQLRKVFELAGMTENVDFVTEAPVETEAGRLRPDAIVSIPGGKTVVIDAKTPLEAYLDALDSESPDDHAAQMKRHAGHLRAHVRALAGKAYQDALPGAPDFIVMFIPGETFVAAAAEADPGILEFAFENRVLIASPTTLIALVKAIAYGWQQEKMAANAAEVQKLGREIHDRLGVFLGHLGRSGRALGQAVEAYNRAVGSMEGRVLPAARRFEALGVVPRDTRLEGAAPIEHEPRSPAAAEALLLAEATADHRADRSHPLRPGQHAASDT